MKRYPGIMGLTESPLRRRCGAQKGTSAHALCTCEALVTLIHHYLGSFALDPEDVRNPDLESSWVFQRDIHPMTSISVPSGKSTS